jgi:hypothetical protein
MRMGAGTAGEVAESVMDGASLWIHRSGFFRDRSRGCRGFGRPAQAFEQKPGVGSAFLLPKETPQIFGAVQIDGQ